MGGDDGHGHGDHGGKKYSIPEAYKKEHEHRGHAMKGAWITENRPSPFWHPAPKDLPEAPVHFNQNPVDLELHLANPRQRLAGMTDAERAWRKKFVLGQRLEPEEPVYVPGFNANFNPLRRIYRIPWDWLERRVLIPQLGYTHGHHVRAIVPKLMMGAVGFLWIYYHMKYHHPTWMDWQRARIVLVDEPLLREEEIRTNYPGLKEKGYRQYNEKRDYHDYDFKLRTSHLNIDPPVRP